MASNGVDIEAIYRRESRRVLATLIRLLRDFDLAEEALHDAFRAALEHWPREGLPANPAAWLVSAGRFKAIDGIRRRARFEPLDDHVERIEALAAPEADASHEGPLEDDRLRLVFTCCHPALAPDAQIALTLREVCGLTTEAIAHAFLVPAPTIAQRIVRAKAKIRDAGIPYEVPGPERWGERLASVMRVIYLVFNEGYAASSGDALLRADLGAEAIRVARLLVELLPGEIEARGLLALMLLHESRRATRVDANGDVVLLEDQDRRLWDRDLVAEGAQLVEHALKHALEHAATPGPYTLQAAIAAVHAESLDAASTDWTQIIVLYTLLERSEPSPVVALNRAVAIAMRDGPQAGLELIDALMVRGELDGYHLAHAARAELLRRLGRHADAQAAYERALATVKQEPERRFLEQRLRQSAP